MKCISILFCNYIINIVNTIKLFNNCQDNLLAKVHIIYIYIYNYIYNTDGVMVPLGRSVGCPVGKHPLTVGFSCSLR